MKKLRWPTNQEMASYMRTMQAKNKATCIWNQYEEQVRQALLSTGLKWTRQAQWGYRIFDFWNNFLGIAIEVDGPYHKPAYDAYRDEYNFRRSGIVVLRIRNGSEELTAAALSYIATSDTLAYRKRQLVIDIPSTSKNSRQRLAKLPYPPSLLQAYLRGGIAAVAALEAVIKDRLRATVQEDYYEQKVRTGLIDPPRLAVDRRVRPRLYCPQCGRRIRKKDHKQCPRCKKPGVLQVLA